MTRPRALRPLCAIAGAGLLAGLPNCAAAQVMDTEIYVFAMLDEAEFSPGLAGNPFRFDGEGWIGGDYDRLWIKAEGEAADGGGGGVELQLLYGRLVAPFFDAQAGVRVDRAWGSEGARTRGLLVVGLQGLAPYWFEVEPALFVSLDGDLSARLTARYELLFTQRLILEPDLEVDAALQEVPEFGVGSGFNSLELGARLRYEFIREIAPYVGAAWVRRFGETADFARASGVPPGESTLVVGLRAWY